jgi:uncharacterized protein involved in propanediol utilization
MTTSHAAGERDAQAEDRFDGPGLRPIEPAASWMFPAPGLPRQVPHKRATCSVMSHWGEVIQGPVVFEGQPQVGLVTLPDPEHYVTASAVPAQGGSQISCVPPSKAKALRAARIVIRKWAPGLGVELTFQSAIPEGVGAGSSTADCTATVYAIREMLGIARSEALGQDILEDVFAAEGPCDPLILLDRRTTVLWGSRSARLLKTYDVPLPPFLALGFVTDPGRTVSTVDLAAKQARTPPTSREIDAFAAVLHDFEQALAARSVHGVARAAQASGSLNQSRCAVDDWDALTKLSESVGALGVSCAHSGTAAAFLFDPAADDLEARLDRATREVQRLRAAHIHRFRTDAMPMRWSGSHTTTVET